MNCICKKKNSARSEINPVSLEVHSTKESQSTSASATGMMNELQFCVMIH